MKEAEEFKEAYLELCKKYKMIVTSCGCCPPFIEPVNRKELKFHVEDLKIVKRLLNQ